MNDPAEKLNVSNIRTWSAEKRIRDAQRKLNKSINEMLQASKGGQPERISEHVEPFKESVDDLERQLVILLNGWRNP